MSERCTDRNDDIVRLLLGAEGFSSGEQMARRLGISRTAVWKHISHLKRLGFEIESQPHLGYRLAELPDALMPALLAHELGTVAIGKRFVHIELTGSTNDVAEALAREGEEEGTVVVAEGQSAGKGRLGRRWHSPSRKGVYLSVLLRPPISPARIPFMTLSAAVAAAEAIRRCAPVEAAVKWPNDVLVGERKVCGILTQLGMEADRIDYAVVGIGINVNCLRKDFPPRLKATSLRLEAGREISRLAVARELLESLDRNYRFLVEGKESLIVDRWLKLATTVGRRIRDESPCGEVWEGVATGLDENGCLLVRLESGLTHRITGGDVTIL